MDENYSYCEFWEEDMFVLIKSEVEEFDPEISCAMLGVYHTFDEAHDAMEERMEKAERREHWCSLETEDLDDEGNLYDENGNYLCKWSIFEVKEED